jgi:superfamily II DNA or RNA helicase
MEKTPNKHEIRNRIQAEAGAIVKANARCGLAVSMGVGKTRIALTDMSRIYYDTPPAVELKFLVVIPRTAIIDSYKDEIAEVKMDHLIDKIDYLNYRSLHKVDLTHYTKIYLDECHSLKYSHEYALDMFGGAILGLTGTPPRYKQSEKGYMVNKFCPMMYTYMQDEAITDRVLNEYKIFVHQLNLSKDNTFRITTKNGQSWLTSEYANYTDHTVGIDDAYTPADAMKSRIFRLSAMKKYPTKFDYLKDVFIPRLLKQDFKFLVFANTKDQADQLAGEYGSYHSTNPESESNMERFKEAERGYMTCVDQIKEGVTIPGLNTSIIMHSYGNERTASQKIGRVLRLAPDQTAYAHILMYQDTVDETWVFGALKDFDSSKIRLFDPIDNKSYKVQV